MGTTYTITGSNTDVVWFFKYDLNGLLREFKLAEGQLDDKQINWLFNKDRFPYHESTIKGWKGIANLKVEVGEPDLSFDVFWQKYAHKVKKSASQTVWKRLSKKDQIDALKAIEGYDKYLARKHIAKAYPSTYLNQRYWEDSFSSIH